MRNIIISGTRYLSHAYSKDVDVAKEFIIISEKFLRLPEISIN